MQIHSEVIFLEFKITKVWVIAFQFLRFDLYSFGIFGMKMCGNWFAICARIFPLFILGLKASVNNWFWDIRHSVWYLSKLVLPNARFMHGAQNLLVSKKLKKRTLSSLQTLELEILVAVIPKGIQMWLPLQFRIKTKKLSAENNGC